MSKNNRKRSTSRVNDPADTSREEVHNLATQRQAGLVGELTSMIMQNKKWWLVPILVMVLALGLIVFLGGTAAAPFIYTLF